MRNLFLTSAAALAMAFGATAVSGQGMNATNANNPSVPANRDMTSQQKSAYETWPADKKAAYDTWTAEYQAYFWSLSPSQQTGWFALTDEQRKQIYDMPPASRAAAWASIEQQLAGTADAAAPPSAATGMARPAEGGAAPMDSEAAGLPDASSPMGSPSAGAASDPAVSAPPAEAMNKTYPKCSRTVQDSCRNPGGV